MVVMLLINAFILTLFVRRVRKDRATIKSLIKNGKEKKSKKVPASEGSNNFGGAS